MCINKLIKIWGLSIQLVSNGTNMLDSVQKKKNHSKLARGIAFPAPYIHLFRAQKNSLTEEELRVVILSCKTFQMKTINSAALSQKTTPWFQVDILINWTDMCLLLPPLVAISCTREIHSISQNKKQHTAPYLTLSDDIF